MNTLDDFVKHEKMQVLELFKLLTKEPITHGLKINIKEIENCGCRVSTDEQKIIFFKNNSLRFLYIDKF